MGHGLIGDEVEDFTLWSVPVLAAATIGLWLLGRPGTVSRWRVACASALASAGDRPARQPAHLAPVGARTSDRRARRRPPLLRRPLARPVLPERPRRRVVRDRHGRLPGEPPRRHVAFFVAAAAIAIARVLLGLHYPGDIAAGALVGMGSAYAVHLVARRPLTAVVAAAGRVTDPVLAPLWRLGRRTGEAPVSRLTARPLPDEPLASRSQGDRRSRASRAEDATPAPASVGCLHDRALVNSVEQRPPIRSAWGRRQRRRRRSARCGRLMPKAPAAARPRSPRRPCGAPGRLEDRSRLVDVQRCLGARAASPRRAIRPRGVRPAPALVTASAANHHRASSLLPPLAPCGGMRARAARLLLVCSAPASMGRR